ncbi:MAG: radical SAM protein [Candidatus Limiplasma sp.]|nr:radical SAM protein [Candidatus Limiplasma sp.]
MSHYSVMIKPASALCNLRCAYCFYCDASAHRKGTPPEIMTRETAERVIQNIFAGLEDGDSLEICFQGGEPTLAGLAYFRHFVRQVRRQPQKGKVTYALQTNGMELDREWCAFLREHRFLVGLSIDAYPQHHNAYRVDAQGKGTFGRVMEAKRLLEETGVEHNVLCTLTNPLARHPQKVWQFIKQARIAYIQFTPCLGGLEGERSEWALTPQRFYSFYTGLYKLWKRDVEEGPYISVKLFDDLLNLFFFQRVTACGLHGQCQIQNIVEADASAYPCDFYALDAYYGGSLREQSLAQVRERLEGTGFLGEREALPEACGECKYRKLCNGGCKRMAQAMYVDAKTGFCGYRHLLEDIGQDLCDCGAALLRKRSP